MSIVNYINRSCPKGVSHSHTTGNNEKNLNSCDLCNPSNVFIWRCANYFRKQTIFVNNQQEKALRYALSQSNQYYLPNELQDIIISYADYTIKRLIDIKLDYSGIDHIMSCRPCSKRLLDWFENNTCNNHVLPRKNYDKDTSNKLFKNINFKDIIIQ